MTGAPPRRVQFAFEGLAQVRYVESHRNMTNQEWTNTWWSKSEFQAIKLSAKFASDTIRIDSKKSIGRIDDLHTASIRLSSALDSKKAVRKFMKRPLKYSEAEAEEISEWAVKRGTGRGLEKYISDRHSVDRVEIARMARKNVVFMSQRQKSRPDKIASYYRDYSQSCKIYARFMGEADAIAAKQVHEPEPRRKLKRTMSAGDEPQLRRSPVRRTHSADNFLRSEPCVRSMVTTPRFVPEFRILI